MIFYSSALLLLLFWMLLLCKMKNICLYIRTIWYCVYAFSVHNTTREKNILCLQFYMVPKHSFLVTYIYTSQVLFSHILSLLDYFCLVFDLWFGAPFNIVIGNFHSSNFYVPYHFICSCHFEFFSTIFTVFLKIYIHCFVSKRNILSSIIISRLFI